MVVLDIEVGAALNAATTVTSEDSLTHFARRRLALSWWGGNLTLFDGKHGVRVLQIALPLPLTVMQQRLHVSRRKALVLPGKTVLVPPIAPS